MNKDFEKIMKLRGISKTARYSVDRNIRACFPKKTEKEIEALTLKIIMNNIENCKGD